jgi:putative aldouronate transport system permease protein
LNAGSLTKAIDPRRSFGARFRSMRRKFNKSRYLFLLVLPGLIFLFVFYYIPLIGILFAFTDYRLGMGVFQAPWVGLRWFIEFVHQPNFWQLLRNTAVLGALSVVWGFPVPVIFALLLNETRNKTYKRIVQSVSYLPHFISTVIIVGMVVTFLQPDTGILWHLINLFIPVRYIMTDSRFFRTIYIASDIWQTFGWNSIMFLAALSSVDPQLYESARMDGANRWRQLLSITLPSILPTVLTLLILRMGSIVDIGFEKVFLLQTPVTYETSDVFSTYVYRVGIVSQPQNFSKATAIGLFNSGINIIFLVVANSLSKKFNETSLW